MPQEVQQPARILVPVLAGIGNAVMTVPLVRRLARLGRVTIAARTRPIADVFQDLPEPVDVEVLGAAPAGAWRMHRRLARSLRPDWYVVPFPSNRWQYGLLAATGGAPRLVMHDYPVGRLRALRFVPRLLRDLRLVPAQRGIHDVTQNLSLLAGLDADPGEPDPPIFPLGREQLDEAARLLSRRVEEGFIAIQPGCGNTPVGRAKRWPAARFAELADILAQRRRPVLVLEGPDERGVGHEVSRLARSHPPVLELGGPLSRSAGVLQQAALYVGNDSGLAHVAAAVGTPPVTLFAAADPARVAPFGYEHLVVTPPPVDGRTWQPLLMYPMDHPGPKLRRTSIDWASHIRLDDVLAAIDRAEADPPLRAGNPRALSA